MPKNEDNVDAMDTNENSVSLSFFLLSNINWFERRLTAMINAIVASQWQSSRQQSYTHQA